VEVCLHVFTSVALWPVMPRTITSTHHNHSLSWLFEKHCGSGSVDNVTRSEHALLANQLEIRKDPQVPNGSICIVILGNFRVAGYDPTVDNIRPRQGGIQDCQDGQR
jgi:hypothetical protein